MILIEENGQRALVLSLDGHEGATVLAENVPEPPPYVSAADLLDDGSVPLSLTRDVLRARIEAIRFDKETGTCVTPVSAVPVSIDEASKAKILGALSLCRLKEEIGQPFTVNFTLSDKSRIALDGTTVRQLAGAVGEYVAALYDHAGDLFDAVDAATTQAELDAIDVEAGWP